MKAVTAVAVCSRVHFLRCAATDVTKSRHEGVIRITYPRCFTLAIVSALTVCGPLQLLQVLHMTT